MNYFLPIKFILDIIIRVLPVRVGLLLQGRKVAAETHNKERSILTKNIRWRFDSVCAHIKIINNYINIINISLIINELNKSSLKNILCIIEDFIILWCSQMIVGYPDKSTVIAHSSECAYFMLTKTV